MPTARHNAPRVRLAHLRGNPTESARLRQLFLQRLGKTETVTSICRQYGLPLGRITKWVSDLDAVLADDLQRVLRSKLGLGAP